MKHTPIIMASIMLTFMLTACNGSQHDPEITTVSTTKATEVVTTTETAVTLPSSYDDLTKEEQDKVTSYIFATKIFENKTITRYTVNITLAAPYSEEEYEKRIDERITELKEKDSSFVEDREIRIKIKNELNKSSLEEFMTDYGIGLGYANSDAVSTSMFSETMTVYSATVSRETLLRIWKDDRVIKIEPTSGGDL